MREITRICDKAGIVCGSGTAATMPDFFDRWGERDTAYMMYGVGRAAFAGWQAWNLTFGDSVSAKRIAEVERLLRNEMAFKWFSIQRVGGRVMFIMTLKVERKAYNVAPPGAGPSPTPTSDDWLWFEMPDGGTVTLTRTGSPTTVTLEVSLDNGATWSEWVEVGNVRTQTLAAGQVMHVRNVSPTPSTFSTSISDYYHFGLSSLTNAGGDIGSLLCSDATIVTVYPAGAFCSLFKNETNLLITPLMPAGQIAGRGLLETYMGCYNLHTCRMIGATNINATRALNATFSGCLKLKNIPELLATKPGSNGCVDLFKDCLLLTEIKVHFTDISSTNALLGWVDGVAPTGEFWCPQALTIPTGDDGIPSGWTRHDL